MRKLLFLSLLTFVLLGCAKQYIIPKFFICETAQPSIVIDSLTHSHKIKVNDFKDWNKAFFINDDSLIVTSYFTVANRGDSLFIFSITEIADYPNFLIKFRIE